MRTGDKAYVFLMVSIITLASYCFARYGEGVRQRLSESDGNRVRLLELKVSKIEKKLFLMRLERKIAEAPKE